MSLNSFFRKRWKTVLGAFLIAVGVDALINNQMVFSNLPPILGGAFQFYYQEPVTKTFPSYLMAFINWPFYTMIIIGGIFVVWDLIFLRKRKQESEMQ